MIITFEGIEGSGKSFHIKNVAKIEIDFYWTILLTENFSKYQSFRIMTKNIFYPVILSMDLIQADK